MIKFDKELCITCLAEVITFKVNFLHMKSPPVESACKSLSRH